MADYLVYDVFTDCAFGGNPLAVFPEAEGLPEAALQKIAREFNFSETVFVYPARDGGDARLRIFTPTSEIPFAGHPTIGTAIALSDLGRGERLVLELGIGPVACEIAAGLARFTVTAELQELARPDPALVAAALSLDPGAIRSDRHAPTMASLGLPFTLTELSGPAALDAATPSTEAYRQGRDAYPSSLDFAQFCYCRDGDRVQARMFAPLDNIPEDPATGSACAALGAFLARLEGAELSLVIDQGGAMGRPSRIEVTARPGGPVTVAGRAVLTMSGRFHLPG